MALEYITPIIAIVPGLLAPAIAWFLSQHGESTRAKKFESLLTRLELVEKLRQVSEQGTDSKDRLVKSLDKEIGDILGDLESLREIRAPLKTTPARKVARWRQYLLAYEQASRKGKFYKGLFYVFVFIAGFGGWGFVLERISQPMDLERISQPMDEVWVFGLIGVVFYLAVGLGFRSAAVRDYERTMKKGVSES